MAYHNQFIPWWKSLPEETRKDIVGTLVNRTLTEQELCSNYRKCGLKTTYLYYIKKMYGLSTTKERDLNILHDLSSGVPEYVIKKEYGIDTIELNAIKDVVGYLGIRSKELF